jgi:acyl dehydratase
MHEELLHLEDLKVGDRYVTAGHRVDEAQIRAFAAEFDPQPFHLDAELAKDSLFQGLAASGWHTAAITMRLMLGPGGPPLAGGLIGASADLRWPRPVRPGDVLHVECEVLEILPPRSPTERGWIRMHSRTVNQRGEDVQTAQMRVLVRTRSQP